MLPAQEPGRRMSGSANWSLVQERIALKAKTSPSSDKRPNLPPGSPILTPSDAASDFSVHIAFVSTALVLPLPINRSMALLGAGSHPPPAATTQRTPCSHEHTAGAHHVLAVLHGVWLW